MKIRELLKKIKLGKDWRWGVVYIAIGIIGIILNLNHIGIEILKPNHDNKPYILIDITDNTSDNGSIYEKLENLK